MRVIVAGSRSLEPKAQSITSRLDALHHNLFKFTEVISGLALGPDLIGKVWAEQNGIPVAKYPADWDMFGRRAGYIRNERMAEYGQVLVAFWDGESKGTKHMIDIALARRLTVIVVPMAPPLERQE